MATRSAPPGDGARGGPGSGGQVDGDRQVGRVGFAADRGQHGVALQHEHRAAQHVHDHLADVGHARAAHHQVGHPVVGLGGAFHRVAARPDHLVGGAQLLQGGAGLGEQPGVVDRHRRVGGQRAEQRHLLLGERVVAAVRGEQHPDRPGAQPHRHPEDGDQPLFGDRGVDLGGVPELVVRQVGAGGVGHPGLGDQPAEPGSQRQPQCPERRRHRPVGDPHIGVAALLVVEGHIRHVGVQQPPRPPHDGLQHRIQVPQPGQVAGGLEQRRQLGFAACPAFQGGPDLQGDPFAPLELFQGLRARPGCPRLQHGGFELDRRSLTSQQLQEELQAHARQDQPAVHPPSMVRCEPVIIAACGVHR